VFFFFFFGGNTEELFIVDNNFINRLRNLHRWFLKLPFAFTNEMTESERVQNINRR